jgi:NADPH2:quinone reductase
MRAIRVYEHGGPDVLRSEEVADPAPARGEVLIRNVFAGVNYADVGQRVGMMGGPHSVALPYTPGFEAIGVVEALGDGVTSPKPGSRVAAVLESGGYAELAVAPAEMTVELPEGVDEASASALLVQGVTAYGLIHDAARLRPGESALVQAAAGGVGSLLVQLAKLAGAGVVIGTAGSERKRELVLSLGADSVVDYRQPGWEEEVTRATGGRGVDVVFECVGGSAAAQAFGTLAPLGRMVIYGGASGQPMPLEAMMMPMQVKGLSLSGYGGPWLRPGRAEVARDELTRRLRDGSLRVVVGQQYPLEDAKGAHTAIESRATLGKTLLRV